jgi:LacI family transcriptional regulator, gluconate utilization system Gnt-I transcriptional repressor
MEAVARRAGVSVITVSRTLREPQRVAAETRSRVLSAVAEIGYVPNLVAGSLKSRRSGFVGGIIPTIAQPIAAEVARGMTEALREQGMRLFLADSGFSPEEEQELVVSMLARRPDAIFLTGITHTEITRRLLSAARIPVVETGNLCEAPIDILVGFSNHGAARMITEAVLGSGRRRIGYLGQTGRGHIDRLQDRFDGFRRALAQAGLPFDESRMVEDGLSYEGGARGLRTLLQRDPSIDAVVCSSDIIALGALFEAQRLGIAVPGRLAIGGIDDTELSGQCVPGLSTVRVPRFMIGRVAGELICRRLAGERIAEPVVDLGFQLVMRGTI